MSDPISIDVFFTPEAQALVARLPPFIVPQCVATDSTNVGDTCSFESVGEVVFVIAHRHFHWTKDGHLRLRLTLGVPADAGA